MKKSFIVVGIISLLAFGNLLFAKPGEGQSSHRSGRGRNERTAPEMTAQPSSVPSQSASDRRERIQKKFRRELSDDVDRRADSEEVKVIVRYRNQIQDQHVGRIQGRGARLKKRFKHHPWIALTVKKADLFSEDFDSELLSGIELDLPVIPHLNTSLPAIAAGEIEKNFSVTGKGVKVAIVDSGIAKNHPGIFGKVAAETDLTGTGEGPTDLNGHGTHVACIVACSDTTYRGVAPEVSLYNAKVMSQSGAGYISDVIAGIEWSIDQKVDVMNLSIGALVSPCDGLDSLSSAVNTAVDKGIMVVVAAGNSGPAANTLTSPGCAEKALTVGAVSDTGVIAEFSSRGPTADGRPKPDIAAPGMDVIAADTGTGFVSKYGTSMAAPHVTGVAALLKSMAPSKTPAEIRDLLLKNVNFLSYDRNTVGTGFLNTQQSIATLKENLPSEPPPTPAPPAPPLPPPAPAEEPILPPPPPPPPSTDSPEEPEELRERGNPLSRCLKGARRDHEAKRECLKEFNPGVHRGFEKFEEAQKNIPEEKIPEKELKAIERIIFQIPVTNPIIERQIEKKLEKFQETIAGKNEDEITKETKKLRSSLKKLKRRAAKRLRAKR